MPCPAGLSEGSQTCPHFGVALDGSGIFASGLSLSPLCPSFVLRFLSSGCMQLALIIHSDNSSRVVSWSAVLVGWFLCSWKLLYSACTNCKIHILRSPAFYSILRLPRSLRAYWFGFRGRSTDSYKWQRGVSRTMPFSSYNRVKAIWPLVDAFLTSYCSVVLCLVPYFLLLGEGSWDLFYGSVLIWRTS